MTALDEVSSRFIVMAERGRTIRRHLWVRPGKIDLIPHGVIDMPFVDSNFYKDEFGVEGKTVLLTFGLLSPNKGIEKVIEAMPAILERNPQCVYLVLGATHPNLLAAEGERLPHRLEALSESLGVAKQVIFHNRFVSLEELKEFIGAADIYLTPYLNEAQITSGTLSYAFGRAKRSSRRLSGMPRSCSSAGERGVLVHFSESGAIAAAVNEHSFHAHAHDGDAQAGMEAGARDDLAVVAQRYMESFGRARAAMSESPAEEEAAPALHYPIPELKLDHLSR